MTAQSEDLVAANMGTKVVQVTNIAPQATRDQMHALFGFLGKIEDIRLYPTIRDVSLPVQSRICYVKYFDASCVGVAQHLTNTVFIDRALIVTPYQSSMGEIPDEYRALDIAAQANVIPGLYPNDPKLPPHIVNQIEFIGHPPQQFITTTDPVLKSNGLPPYPPLPVTYDSRRIEEIRRTLVVINVDESITAEQLIDFFQKAGDVKYVKFCTRDNDSNRYALVEFSEQGSIIPGLKLNMSELAGKVIQVYHSTQAIQKPMAKSNEAAQREIEEAMTRVKEAQSMISAAIDPVIGILSKDKKRSRSSSRSRRRSRSRSGHRHRSHSRSRHRSKHSRRSSSRSRRSHSRRSHSRTSRSKRRSRSRGHHRSRSRDHGRTHSRKSRERKRSRSRDHSKSHHRHKSKERHRSRSGKRSRSRSESHVSSRSKSRRSTRDESRKSSRDKDKKSDRKKEGSRKSRSKEGSVASDKSGKEDSRKNGEKDKKSDKERKKEEPRKSQSKESSVASDRSKH